MIIRYLAGVAALAFAFPVATGHAQDLPDLEERPITLTGCVMAESDYRDLIGPGLSGPRGAGIGMRDEFVLVDAREVSGGATAEADPSATCAPTPGGLATAYELTGDGEKTLAEFAGRRVVVTGTQKAADDARAIGTSGTVRVDGGFDALGHELHLAEVNVESARLPAARRAEAPVAAPPAAVPAPEPAPPAAAPEPEPAIAAAPAQEPEIAPAPSAQAPEAVPQVARRELPRTASPLPLAGLLGLVSLAAAAGVRGVRRRIR